MTNEQLKSLAAVVLNNSAKIDLLSAAIAKLIERMPDSGHDFEGRAKPLPSDQERLAALSADAEKAREELRRYFGL